MKIKCPWCSQKYEVEEQHIGLNVNCEICNKDFVVDAHNIVSVPIPAEPLDVLNKTEKPQAEPEKTDTVALPNNETDKEVQQKVNDWHCVSCPHCNQRLRIKNDSPAKKARCPKCKKVFENWQNWTDKDIWNRLREIRKREECPSEQLEAQKESLQEEFKRKNEARWNKPPEKERQGREQLEMQKKYLEDHQKLWGEQQKQKQRTIEFIHQHIRTLWRKYEKCFYADDYGKQFFQSNKWFKEVSYFRQNILDDQTMLDFAGIDEMRLSELIIKEIEAYKIQNKSNSQYSNDMSGVEYEKLCKSILEQHGWACRLTQQSGDQGADIIAERHGKIIAFQCKRYTASVGNKAIQEVYAAKGHYKADSCAVVSNISYTKSARELAQSLNVLLLHHSDLDNI